MKRLDMVRSRPSASLLMALLLFYSVATPLSGAFMTDTNRITENSFRIGLYDGKLSEVGPATENSTTDETKADDVNHTWADRFHRNGSTDVVNNTLRIANTDTTHDVDYVDISVSYVQNDSGIDDSTDDSVSTAKSMNVSEFTYNGTDLIDDRITDNNGNGAIDLDDVTTSNLSRLDGISDGGDVSLIVAIAGDATTSDDVEGGDGVDFELTVELVVAPSWSDSDTSANNTIQYAE